LRQLALILLVFSGRPDTASAQTFADEIDLGTIAASEITEASGLVASRQNPGVLWVHNDSGFPGSVFALSTNGALLARYTIPEVFFGDFEDLAIGPGPSPEAQYIYLGDIGDNFASRSRVRIFRFPEPAVYPFQSANPRVEPALGAQEIELTYPDGPFNAEALMLDPITGDLFIATKDDNFSRIYRATRAQLDDGGPVALTFIKQITFQKVSAGDISPDGRMVVLRRGGRAALWNRSPTQSIGDALVGSGTTIPIADEPNGEAICFHPTGLGYYTTSEAGDNGLPQPIYFYRRTDNGVPRQPVVLIKPGDVWRYQDLGANEGTAWRQASFDDAEWSAGPAQLGYGQGDEQTAISFGFDDFAKNPTTYFRKQFMRPASVPYTNLVLRVCFNDGMAVYLNGIEIVRRNLALDATFDTPALASNSERQNYWLSVPLNPTMVMNGLNTISVELHRLEGWEPDLSFDLQLGEGFVNQPPIHFTGLPELSGGTWRITISGPIGSLARVEASNDLQAWMAAGEVVLPGGIGLFQESAVPGATHRFYRLNK
jgi:hypothetical protein